MCELFILFIPFEWKNHKWDSPIPWIETSVVHLSHCVMIVVMHDGWNCLYFYIWGKIPCCCTNNKGLLPDFFLGNVSIMKMVLLPLKFHSFWKFSRRIFQQKKQQQQLCVIFIPNRNCTILLAIWNILILSQTLVGIIYALYLSSILFNSV